MTVASTLCVLRAVQVGLTKTDKLVEVQRPDLVGEYVGHTGPKTQKKIDEAKEGVLFIDEVRQTAFMSRCRQG